MIDQYLIFQFVKGHCHGNQIMLGESNEGRLIPRAFFALAYVHINSCDDQATSGIDLVGF